MEPVIGGVGFRRFGKRVIGVFEILRISAEGGDVIDFVKNID
jgi:hypothetical protein